MESSHNESTAPITIGDRSTSDVVVRIRTQDGRDDWIYCHSHILINKSKYFADRLSNNWPTCQILDSRNCVEVNCEECDFDYHITVLRLLYIKSEPSISDLCGVKNSLGTLRVAVNLGCPKIVSICVDYLEAVPWEESEEEEILKIVPQMGPQAEIVLARIRPVNSLAVVRVFMSAIRFATSSPGFSMSDLKHSAQEQLEYMLTEDDDAPLLTVDDEIKLECGLCFNGLLSRFVDLVESLFGEIQESRKMELFYFYVCDLSWTFQIVSKLEISREFVHVWLDTSAKIVKLAEGNELTETKMKVLEVTSKVMEAIGYGVVVLPANKRLHVVIIWLPYVRLVKSLFDSVTSDDENNIISKFDAEIWQSIESSFVSIILTLPSGNQAEILKEWLDDKQIRYPDLTEAFEAWCYRSKVSKRRLSLIEGNHQNMDKL